MNYRIIPVTAFAQNCSLIWCEQTKLAALVDPGGDAEKIKEQVLRLREEFAIYAVASGRINVAGMTPDNMAPLCEAIVAVL